MSNELTITLSDHASHWVFWYAQMTGRSASQVIGETVEQSLSQIAGEMEDLSSWSDEEVLAAADSKMPAAVESRLNELLERQDDGRLSPGEKKDLAAIAKLSQLERLGKARGMAEAINRGLRGRGS